MDYNFEGSNHNQRQYFSPTSYGPTAHFTSDDLGSQAQFNGYMERTGSSYSNANSYDSAIDVHSAGQYMYRNNSQSSSSTSYHNQPYSHVDNINPSALSEQHFHYFPSPADSYPVQAAPGTRYPVGSYNTNWQTPRGGSFTFEQLVSELPSTPMSPGTQPSSVQSSQPPKYQCLEKNCNTSFARQADLQRHYLHKHTPIDKQQTWYCDWKTCTRSEPGYREALARLGQSASSQTQKHTGIGPFTRKDHFKAHLREQHQEAIPKRDPKADPGWAQGKNLREDWWRCGKCLKRVWIRKQRNEGRNEYTCCDCSAPCDQEVLDVRMRMFGSGSRGRKH